MEENNRICPKCLGDDYDESFDYDEGYEYYQCNDCGYIWWNIEEKDNDAR